MSSKKQKTTVTRAAKADSDVTSTKQSASPSNQFDSTGSKSKFAGKSNKFKTTSQIPDATDKEQGQGKTESRTPVVDASSSSTEHSVKKNKSDGDDAEDVEEDFKQLFARKSAKRKSASSSSTSTSTSTTASQTSSATRSTSNSKTATKSNSATTASPNPGDQNNNKRKEKSTDTHSAKKTVIDKTSSTADVKLDGDLDFESMFAAKSARLKAKKGKK